MLALEGLWCLTNLIIVMTNLNKTFKPLDTSKYDWNFIEDPNNRAAAKSTVLAFQNTVSKAHSQVTQLAEQTSLALSRCVYTLKLTLPHGEFTDVCEKALHLSKDDRAAHVKVGRELTECSLPDDTILLLENMETRAAAKLIAQPEEDKVRYVAKFKETGEVPSQRTFTPKKRVATVKTTREELMSTITFLTSWLEGVEKISPEGKELLIKLSESIERVL